MGETTQAPVAAGRRPTRPLLKVLGTTFGIAAAIGGTIGTGILRTPGPVAQAIPDSGWLLVAWLAGALFVAICINTFAELVTALPRAGGPYVYARRAFGNGVGFVVGWSDWLNQAAAIAYAALTAAVFIATLWPASAEWPRAIAIAVIGGFTVMHWAGLRIGSTVTRVISLTIGLMMLVLVVACFIAPSVAASGEPPAATSAAALPLL